jgi:hypothetical protein
MKIYWQHVVLILGLAVIALLGAVLIPEHAYDKIGSGLAIAVADPIGAVGAVAVLGSIVGGLVAAYRRALHTPPPSIGTTTTRSTGEPRS